MGGDVPADATATTPGEAGVQAVRAHRAQRRQRSLDRLREAAKTSESARKLLAVIDPDGTLRFTDDAEVPDGTR